MSEMLIVFGGLPGVGKTTIARAVAVDQQATYLRIDTIEHAIRAAGLLRGDVGTAGYDVANAIARENLAAGRIVIVDCVNPVIESRTGWRVTAARAGAGLIEVEVTCSDRAEHRRRVEGRLSDIADFTLPSWEEVLRREFQPWDRPHVVLDTALLTIDGAVAVLQRHIERWRPGRLSELA